LNDENILKMRYLFSPLLVVAVKLALLPVLASEEPARVCGPGAVGFVRSGATIHCIRRGPEKGVAPVASTRPRVRCSANGWCNVASSAGGDTFSVKILSSNGDMRTAYVNNSGRPWMFDCTGSGGKRLIVPGSSSYSDVIPGSVGESAYDYVCGQ
jgi:hypothetical protein